MADFSVWCSMTNEPGCCGLLEFNFNVSFSLRASSPGDLAAPESLLAG